MQKKILNIGNNIDFISIVEPKFKTHTIEAVFMVPLCEETNAAYSLVSSLLSGSCEKYPTLAALTRKTDTLYGASISGSVGKRSDVLQVALAANTIDNRYALEQEDLLSEITELLIECLFRPNAKDGAFDATEFRIQKQDLLDAIDAEINNKRSYAVARAVKTAFAGEPYAGTAYGEKSDVERLDPAGVYQAYERLLREAVIRIYHVGPSEAPVVAQRMQEAFAAVERQPAGISYRAPSPCKEETAQVIDPMSVNQSKLVLVFKGEEPKKGAMKLMSALYGSSPFSMLFMNVREKMSLCYYCASRTLPGKGALLVDSGVELSNAEKAKDAILAQLDAVRRGEFDDEMLKDAKHSMVNQLRGVGDTPSSCISWCHSQFYDQDEETTEEAVARYEALTRQDIIDAANALKLDTVYLMQQEVQE